LRMKWNKLENVMEIEMKNHGDDSYSSLSRPS